MYIYIYVPNVFILYYVIKFSCVNCIVYIYTSLFVNVINIYIFIYIYTIFILCMQRKQYIYIYTNYIIKLCNQIYVLYWGFCIYTYIQHIFELNEYTKHGKLVMSQTMVRIERECNWKPWKHGDMIKIWKNKWWLNINIWQH